MQLCHRIKKDLLSDKLTTNSVADLIKASIKIRLGIIERLLVVPLPLQLRTYIVDNHRCT